MMDIVDSMDEMDLVDTAKVGPRPRRPQSPHGPRRPLAATAILSMIVLAFSGCGHAARPLPAPAAAVDTPPPPAGGDLPSQAEQIISDALSDTDPQIRGSAAEVVASTRQLRLVPKVVKLLADPAVPVRFAAILALGDLTYTPAQENLTRLLTDPDPNIKIAAAYALTRLGQAQYNNNIRTAITSSNQTVRANAALLLGKSGRKEGLPFLYWTLQRDDSSDMVVLQTAEAIAMLHDPPIYRKLWTSLISAYADDRVIGVRAMGALGTDEAKSVIVTMLDDSVPEVRLAAAEQLGRRGDTVGEAEVLAVFEKNLIPQMDAQGQQRVKTLAALAIGEIGTDRPAKYLPQLLQDPSKGVRLAAAKAVLRRAMKKP
jgi:HEAT repeat protein